MGLSFKVLPAHIDEHHSGFKAPHAIARSIALRKAQAISDENPESWVIGSDTIVVLSGGSIAVKPKDRADAKRILTTYRNSYCNVYSGLALINKEKGALLSGFERTKIIFNDFSSRQLEDYLDTGQWKGRSGAMTIEGKDSWTKRMEGEYWNVVGLPVDLLKKMLKEVDLI